MTKLISTFCFLAFISNVTSCTEEMRNSNEPLINHEKKVSAFQYTLPKDSVTFSVESTDETKDKDDRKDRQQWRTK